MKPILVSILILFSVSTYAQNKKWGLQECMRYAVENNPKVNKQLQQNNIRKQNYMEAIGKLLPSLNGGSNVNFGSGWRQGNDGIYTTQNSFTNSYAISSSLTIFDGLANINNLKMQRVNRVLGKHQLQNEKDQLAYETMEAYMNILYYKGLVDMSQQQLNESTETLVQMRRMQELGLKSFPDVAEACAKEAEDKFNLTKQRNILTIALILLKEKMNLPIDEDLDLIDYEKNDILIAKSTQSAFEIYNTALSQLPEVVMAQQKARASELAYKSSKGSLLPRISLNMGYNTDFYRPAGGEYDSYGTQLKNRKGQYIGFSLSLPIFNGFSNSAHVKRNKAEMIISRSEKEETLRKIYSDIEQAVADMDGQVDEYQQSKEQTEAMKLAHDANSRKYKEGLVSAIELSTSSNRLLKARVEELNSFFKYHLKEKLVDYYKGKPYLTKE